MSDDLDVVVIGGGPAGSLSALLLARLGWRAALIERGPRNRAKACGHCLSQRACRLLQRHGLLDEVRRLSAGPIRRLRVHLQRRTPLSASLDANAGQKKGLEAVSSGLLVDRRRFDQLLIDRAAEVGVQVIQPASARVRAREAPRTIVDIVSGQTTRRVQCALVIGADGLRSAVAKAAGLATAAHFGRKFGFSADVQCPYPAVIQRDTIEMFVVDGGYLGVVNHGGGILHLAGLISHRSAISRNPYAFIGSVAERFDLLRDAGLNEVDLGHCGGLLGAGPIPWRPRHVANERVALVGDAAGYVEPFTGEGMCGAMESAEVLVDVVAEQSPGTWTGALADRFRRSWCDRIGRRQRICSLLAMVLNRPALGAALFRAASGHPVVARTLVRRVVMS